MTRPVTIKLVDLNDKQVDVITFPPRGEGEAPRTFVWCGRKFREDDTGFYDELTAVEVASGNHAQG